MRRQTQPHGLAARWPLRPMEIDPSGLPVRYSLPVNCDADHAHQARDLIEINQASIAVSHEVAGARVVRRSLALEDFTGIAIRIESVDETSDGFAISVNLHHPDPKLCFPLYMSFDMDEVGERWQSWGRALKLPLLLPERDGGWREAVERIGKLKVKPPCQRHPRMMLGARRSEISSVREMGDLSLVRHIAGREMIARN